MDTIEHYYNSDEKYEHNHNIINHSYIDYIIGLYVPELKLKLNDRSMSIKLGLFRESMLHPTSQATNKDKNYQRLEFLGDSNFHLNLTEYLFLRYDEENEGFLTRLRIRLERGDSMAELAIIMGLDSYVRATCPRLNEHILEDVFEAFIGAFYLNFGQKYTLQLISTLLERHKDFAELISYDDNYKDLLLRYFHQTKWNHPIYLENADGSYTNKTSKKYSSIVKNPYGKVLGIGTGVSKKKAEQNASYNALVKLKVIVNGEIDENWIEKIQKDEMNEKDKNKGDKKVIPVLNPHNRLLTHNTIKEFINSYGINFPNTAKCDIKLFTEAMTHRSYLKRKIPNQMEMNPKDAKKCIKLQPHGYDRLRFLGDAVIHFVLAEYLYHHYPNKNEGFLTRLRCKLENRDALFYLAKATGIADYVLISQGIELLHGRTNVNIIGGAFEAFFGALYKQFGLRLAKEFLLVVIRKELDMDTIVENDTNYKDMISQLFNKNHWGYPTYKILKEEGPDHAKIFTIGLIHRGTLLAKGKAYSKKKGEQKAAKRAYFNLTKQPSSLVQ